MFFVDRHERARDPHAQSVRLASEATARGPHSDVEVPVGLNELEGLFDPNPEARPGEILLEGAAVDGQVTLPWPGEDARHSRLATAHCLNLLVVGHFFCQSLRSSGFCPWWGCSEPP